MIDEQTVESIILKALENLNAELPEDRRVPVSLDTPLFGVDAEIDSLSLVSLIVDIETTLTADHGLDVVLTDDNAINQPVSPFTNAGTLKRYILSCVAA